MRLYKSFITDSGSVQSGIVEKGEFRWLIAHSEKRKINKQRKFFQSGDSVTHYTKTANFY